MADDAKPWRRYATETPLYWTGERYEWEHSIVPWYPDRDPDDA
jgi:hypothetical protein